MWLTAFLDVPAASAEAESTFWEAVTATSRSAVRGAREEFWSLVPDDGDPVLRVQRLDDGPAGLHLDLHAADPRALADRATGLGAELVGVPDHTVHRSLGGLVFCVVGTGPSRRPGALSLPHASGLDQVCVDVPEERYDAEVTFWSRLLDRQVLASPTDPEFSRLAPDTADSLRVLLRRTRDDGPVRAHLDLATDDRADEVERMHALGAGEVRRADSWTTLIDPAGLPFCVTDRDPAAPWTTA